MTFYQPQPPLAAASSRRAVSELNGKDCVESLMMLGLVKDLDLDLSKDAELEAVFDGNGLLGIPATHWESTRPCTRTAAAQSLAVSGYSNVAQHATKLKNVGIRTDVMKSIMELLNAERAVGVGGFSDLDEVLAKKLPKDAIRLLFAAVFSRWICGNVSKSRRTDVPAHVRVDVVAPFGTYETVFLEAMRRASPSMFVKPPPGGGFTPAAGDAVLTGVKAGQTPVTALELSFQNKYLQDSDNRRFNSEQLVRNMLGGLQVVRDFRDLERFRSTTLEALEIWRPDLGSSTLELDKDLSDFADSVRRVLRRDGAIPKLQLLSEIAEYIPSMKLEADARQRRVKQQLKRAKETTEAEKDAERVLKGAKSGVDAEMQEWVKGVIKSYHSAAQSPTRGARTPRQKNPTSAATGTTPKTNAPNGGGSPSRRKGPVSDALEILRKKFPDASKEQHYKAVKKHIFGSNRCMACHGDTTKTATGKSACTVSCGRSDLHSVFKSSLLALTTLD